MIPTEPEVKDSGRYTISQTGKHLGLSFKTIQKYTDQGALKCTIHKATGKKLYTGADIKKFWRQTY